MNTKLNFTENKSIILSRVSLGCVSTLLMENTRLDS